MQLFLITLVSAALSIIASVVAEQLQKPIHILGTFIMLRLSHNSGIAFSVTLPVVLQSTLILLALSMMILFALKSKRTALDNFAFGSIIGGALGNLYDRFCDGLVTDYISIGTFPVFNIADTFICIGVGLLLLENLSRKSR